MSEYYVDDYLIDVVDFIYPRRLVWIKMSENCMFCKYPKGNSYIRHVYSVDRIGYIHCSDCKSNAINMVKIWKETFSFGRVNYLQGQDIKIKRSSGEIESGWILYNPIIRYDDDGIKEENERVHCYNEHQKIGRWCSVNEVIILNPDLSKI
jgi:hypothetical protein